MPTPPVPEHLSARRRGPARRTRERPGRANTPSSRVGARRHSRRSSCAPSSRLATTLATSATRASRAAPTATSPPPSGATRTSSATGRCCGSSASPTTRFPRRSPTLAEWASVREREAAQAEHAADAICLAWLLDRRLFELGWEADFDGEVDRSDRLGAVRPLRRGVRGLPACEAARRRLLRARPARHGACRSPQRTPVSSRRRHRRARRAHRSSRGEVELSPS